MFEAYTEATRKIFLMARYEAGKSIAVSISVEHVFLGFLRSEPELAIRLFKSHEKVRELSERMEADASEMPAGSQSESATGSAGDLPFSRHCKRVIAYAAAEAENLHHRHITPEHLLLGIVRENTSLPARVILDTGVTILQLEAEATRASAAAGTAEMDWLPNLVADARVGVAQPLIGRQSELAQIIQILCRRSRNSAVLIGESGVGKAAIVRGLAQRLAREDAPDGLADRPILQVAASELARAFDPAVAIKSARLQMLADLPAFPVPILFVRGLFDLRQDMPILAEKLKRGRLQIIATASPLSYRLALDRKDEMARCFESVAVLPASEGEAIQIVTGVKEAFEAFHGVVYSPESIATAVSGSLRFLRTRSLPDGALDLLDDAGTRVKLRSDVVPPEIGQAKARLRRISKQMEHEVLQHNLDLVRKLAAEEQQQRETLTRLEREHAPSDETHRVTAEHVVEAVALRTSLSPAAVKAALDSPEAPEQLTEIRNKLSTGIPVGRRDWIDGLLAYLTDCSKEDADRLAQRIQAAKAVLEKE